ncbi:hypothetical protein AKJ09_01743 [Labilithrix luteola]|uniref:Type IV fimbrial biogenesis protein PilY1 n=1 Tax=Labilithrix luteola TaxID=1391654 RepID=A0A0K1PPM8_9BACT|nr:hypothetical protein [Labilithrix luteola]AKU95079.1 hypothetical protein AKJ09_01743 [Labilithrix luteola]
MSVRWTALLLVVAACASTESTAPQPEDDSRVPVPPPPPADSGVDATSEVDAGPCADCEYFPSVCSPDALCPNGPFDSDLDGGSLDQQVTITAIRGRSASDVWAVGTKGSVVHFDGTTWNRSELGSLETLRGLWLRDIGEVAIASWTSVYTRDVDVPDADPAPSAGGWTSTSPTLSSELKSSFHSYPMVTNAWSAPGSQWLWCSSMTTRPDYRLSGLWRMRQSPSNQFEIQAGVPSATCNDNGCLRMRSIHGATADELWAVGESGVAIRILGAESDTPSIEAFNTQTSNALNGVWCATSSEAWAVGANGTIRHYTGDPMLWAVVSDVPTTETLHAVSGSSATDVWAVGEAGVVLHYDGAKWSRVKVAGLGKRRPNLKTVWVSEPGHVWVGGEGTILSIGGKS